MAWVIIISSGVISLGCFLFLENVFAQDEEIKRLQKELNQQKKLNEKLRSEIFIWNKIVIREKQNS